MVLAFYPTANLFLFIFNDHNPMLHSVCLTHFTHVHPKELTGEGG